MNIIKREKMRARLREYFTICNIRFREHVWNGMPAFVYVYNKDKTDPCRSTKCAAIIYDDFLAVRHYDLLARVCDEAGFAEYCFSKQNEIGTLGFEKGSGRVFYETTTLFTEEIPGLDVIELLNRCAEKYLYERAKEYFRWARFISPFGPESRFCGDLPESVSRVDPAPEGTLNKMMDAMRKNTSVKKTTARITGKKHGRFAVYTAYLCIGRTRLISLSKTFRRALCSIQYDGYEKTPLSISLEGEEICIKIQIVTDRAYTAPDETPRPIWVDMQNFRIKTEEDGEWMSLPEAMHRQSERVLK